MEIQLLIVTLGLHLECWICGGKHEGNGFYFFIEFCEKELDGFGKREEFGLYPIIFPRLEFFGGICDD